MTPDNADKPGVRRADPGRRLAVVTSALADRLARRGGVWIAGDSGVRGPGRLAVRVLDPPAEPPGHIDIGFVLDRDRPGAPVVWDCVTGLGDTEEVALVRAADLWAASTAPVVLELNGRRGEHADRFRPGEVGGYPGRHTVHGPVLGFGAGTGPAVLQRWVLDRPLLPELAPYLADRVPHGQLAAIAVLFGCPATGAELAEVRVNGHLHGRASARLLDLDWPRPPGPAFARLVALLVLGAW